MTVPLKRDAQDLRRWTTIQLFNPLGQPYTAVVRNVSVEADKVTLFVQLDDEAGTSLPTISCKPTDKVVVISAAANDLRGKLAEFIKYGRQSFPEDDYDSRSGSAVLDELEELLKAHTGN